MIRAGSVVWVDLGAPAGTEQGGRRPGLVISSADHLDVTRLVTVLPCTTRDRGWPNHVALRGAGTPVPTLAMTEQPRTISRERIRGVIGDVGPECMADVMAWVSRWLAGPATRRF